MTTLKPKQIRAIESLARGDSQARAAEFAGVTSRTILNWLQRDRGFQVELSRQREGYLRAGVTRLTGSIELAIDTLRAAAESREPVSPESVRAANHLLTHAKAFGELGALSEKLETVLQEMRELRESKREGEQWAE